MEEILAVPWQRSFSRQSSWENGRVNRPRQGHSALHPGPPETRLYNRASRPSLDGFDLERCPGKIARLCLYGGIDAQVRQRATDNPTGEPEVLQPTCQLYTLMDQRAKGAILPLVPSK